MPVRQLEPLSFEVAGRRRHLLVWIGRALVGHTELEGPAPVRLPAEHDWIRKLVFVPFARRREVLELDDQHPIDNSGGRADEMVARRVRNALDRELDCARIRETGRRAKPHWRELLGDELIVLESTVHDAHAKVSGRSRCA